MNLLEKEITKAIEIIPQTSLVLQEFLALLVDIKPVLIYGIRFQDIELIKSYFPQLIIMTTEKGIERKGQQYDCVISKSKSLALEARDLYIQNTYDTHNNSFQRLGTLLGYPSCCVLNFLNHLNQNQHHNHPLLTYNTYKTSKRYYFLTNNLLNFSTRLSSDDDWNKFGQFIKLNFDFWKREHAPHHYFQFISHIPCRYDCQESIKIGKKIQSLLKKYTPSIENIVHYTLSKPILFFDLFKLVIFDGYLKKGILYYQKIIPPFFLVDNSLMEKIKSGNRIIVDNKKIEILRDDSTLFVYQKKNEADGFILDFSEVN